MNDSVIASRFLIFLNHCAAHASKQRFMLLLLRAFLKNNCYAYKPHELQHTRVSYLLSPFRSILQTSPKNLHFTFLELIMPGNCAIMGLFLFEGEGVMIF